MKFKLAKNSGFMVFKYLILFLLLLNASIFSITVNDSLKQKLLNASDEQKLDIYLKFSEPGSVEQNIKIIEYARKAYDLSILLKNRRSEYKALRNLSNLYFSIGDYEKSLTVLQKIIEICRELNEPLLQASAYLEIGLVYSELKLKEKAIQNFKIAAELAKKEGNSEKVLLNVLFLVRRYAEMGNHLDDVKLIEDQLPYLKAANDTITLSRIYNNIGYAYFNGNEFQKAENYYLLSMNLMEKTLVDSASICTVKQNLGEVYLAQEKWEKAIAFLDSAGLIAEKIDNKRVIATGYKLLAKYHEKVGDFRKALNFYTKFAAINDSIFSASMINKTSESLAKMEIQEKEFELENIKKEADSQRYLFIFISFIAIIVAIEFLRRYRLKNKLNSKLQKFSGLLEKKLSFVRYISGTASEFINLPPSEIENGIVSLMKSTCEITSYDFSFVLLNKPNASQFSLQYKWTSDEKLNQSDIIKLFDQIRFPNIYKAIHDMDYFQLNMGVISRFAEGDEAAKLFENSRVNSLVTICLRSGGAFYGILVFCTIKEDNSLEADDLEIFRIVAKIISNSIERQISNTAIRNRSEQFKSISEISSDCSFIFDFSSDGLISVEWATASFYEVMGYHPEEISFDILRFQLIHPDDNIKLFSFLDNLKTGLKDEVEARILAGGKTLKWVRHKGRLLGEINADKSFKAICSSEDITFRKEIESAFYENERIFRLFFENLPFGAVVTKAPEMRMRFNDAMVRFLGYSKEALESLSPKELVRTITHPEDIEEEIIQYRKIQMKKESTYVMEKRYIRNDGTIVWGELGVVFLYDNNNDLSYIFHIIQDITEQKLAQSALKESEAKYKSLVDNIPMISWIVDKYRNTNLISNNILDLCWFTPEEMYINSSEIWKEFVFIDDRRKLKDCFNAFLDNGNPYEIDYRFFRKDNKIIWIREKSINIFEQNGNKYAYAILSDITAEKEMQRVLFESEQRFRSLAEIVPEVAIQGYDKNARTIFWNKASEKYYGYTELEVLGKKFDEIFTFESEEIKDKIMKEFYLGINGAIQMPPAQLKVQGKYNNKLVIYTNYVVMKNLNGEGELYCLDIDLTERSKSEEQLRKALNEKEILLKEVYHRVKNNLQIISSLLSLQSRKLKDPDSLKYFKESQQRVNSMALIHQSLYQSGNLEKIDFAKYIVDLVGQLKVSYYLAIEGLETIIEVEEVLIDLDRAIPLGLILNEIITNSLKYAFPVASINTNSNDTKIISIVMYRNTEGKSVLIISDNGIGFSKDINLEESDSLGFQLIYALVTQVDGELETNFTDGTEYKITF